MCEIVDVLLGFLAGLQIANSDDVMGPSGKNDRSQNELDGDQRAIEVAQTGFNWQAGAGQQPGARNLVGKAAFEPCTNQIGNGETGQGSETCIDGNDHFAIANQKPLY